jgi:hypothetical protein
MDHVVELPAEPQTFALEDSQGILKKLRWEIDGLRAASGYPSWEEVAYRADNCATTAWSIVDWIWVEMEPIRAQEYGSDVRFRAHCRTRTPHLEICDSLANSSKHRTRTPRQFNAAIDTKMVAEVKHARAGQMRAGDRLATWKWEAKIFHHGVEHDALDIFERVYSDLLQIIETHV